MTDAAIIEAPEGFTLRTPRAISAASRRSRPVSYWRGDLRRFLEAGAGERWITPREARMGPAGGITNSLLDRGALLIAEKGSAKRYRLTPFGVRVAGGSR